MSEFCTRCGSPLNDDGTCPRCDAAGGYSVPGIFDEPQVYGTGYDEAGAELPDAVDAVDEVEEVADSGYSGYNGYGGYGGEPYADADSYGNTYGNAESYGNTYGNSDGYDNTYGNFGSYGSSSPQTPPPAPSSAPSSASRKSSMTGVVEALKDWADCAVSFFRKEPFDAVKRVLDGGMYLWGIFAGLNVVFGAFCVAGMFGNGFRWLLDKVFGSYAMLVNFFKEYTFGNMAALFFFSLLILTLLFGGVAGCEYGFLSMAGKKPRVEKVLRIVAVSFFPMTAACLGAYLLSFLLIRLAGLLLLAGAVASFCLLNEVVRREYGELSFWQTALCNTAQLLAALVAITVSLAVI